MSWKSCKQHVLSMSSAEAAYVAGSALVQEVVYLRKLLTNLGFPQIEANGWNGLFAPAKTPREVIERLQKEVAAAVRHPDLAKRLNELGADPQGSSAAELDAILRGQIAQFRPILTELRPSVE